MKQKEYYTAGELARLFNIPKQTMLYYDKMGVLQPEFIAENGYRYYATPQYLTLEIILFLRKMDISVPDIRNFLQHKSREEILKVIAKGRTSAGSRYRRQRCSCILLAIIERPWRRAGLSR